jgi:NDP-sugar pyrophosphorylase family protein
MGKIFGYETPAIFLDIGTPETYQTANQLSLA